MPVFGSRIENVTYVKRPSVYAVIGNTDGLLAIVRTGRGVALPGGGIEPDETPEQALRREVREECGLEIRIGPHRGDAVQLVYAKGEATYFEKISTFFDAEIVGTWSGEREQDHDLLWVTPDEAAILLSHESHRWAISRS